MRISAVTVLLSVTLLTLPSCDRIEKRKREKEALNELNQARHDMNSSYQMTENGLEVDQAQVDRNLESVQNAGRKLGGKAGEAVRIAAEMGKESGEVTKQIQSWSEEFAANVDFKSLSEKRDYDTRITFLNNFREFNQKVIDDYQNYGKELSRRLDAIDFKGKEREDFERGAMKSIDKIIPAVKIVRTSDIEAADLFIGVLKRLKKADDVWKWDPAQDSVIFESDTEMAYFNQEMMKFSGIGERQQAAQRQLIESLRR